MDVFKTIRCFQSEQPVHSLTVQNLQCVFELEAVPEFGIEAMTLAEPRNIHLHQHKRTAKEHDYNVVVQLEEWYRENQNRDGRSYLDKTAKEALATQTGLTQKQVSVWVANRRNRKGR
eukprot:TRINITY_DN22129_c0_g1_i1.p1 TRINITY_DN22129_c0_g1~~TRINITY_DN22129_c0_g1_i1.p1  ORF type:complete len:130 (+),score=7.84 TRINITY_DN22129_c0_g1_i1:38-391(+)